MIRTYLCPRRIKGWIGVGTPKTQPMAVITTPRPSDWGDPTGQPEDPWVRRWLDYLRQLRTQTP